MEIGEGAPDVYRRAAEAAAAPDDSPGLKRGRPERFGLRRLRGKTSPTEEVRRAGGMFRENPISPETPSASSSQAPAPAPAVPPFPGFGPLPGEFEEPAGTEGDETAVEYSWNEELMGFSVNLTEVLDHRAGRSETAFFEQFLAELREQTGETEGGDLGEKLALFHHDPDHTDAFMDQLVENARKQCGAGMEIVGAMETASLHVG